MELLKIKTQQFEGPLDLMLFLIQKNELDISALSLHQITDQYVQYVNLMREIDFDLASEFLVMAAALIYLKSKRLLPADDEVVTVSDQELPQSEAEILRRLAEYKRFQEAGQRLLELPRVDETVFTRPNVLPPERQTVWKEIDLTVLTLSFQDVLRRSRRRSRIIIRESISIPERIVEIGKILKVNELTEFSSILTPDSPKIEIVGTFVALLEMSRLKKLKIFQNEVFGSIYLTLTEELSDFDPKLVTGFQYRAHQNILEFATAGAATS